ncbi:MAG: extracellular solute-binding protein [Anaerolineae bacterium]|nr:extracellular solute-binding protein [Anaerolineae bacterium]
MKINTLITTLIVTLWISLLLTACGVEAGSNTAATARQAEGAILLWHDWTGAESAYLNSLLDRFRQLHPQVSVISVAVPQDELVATFQERTEAGLGPDLLLVDSSLAFEMAQAGLLKDLGQRDDIDRARFLGAALNTIRDGDQLYGLPFSLHTQVLYYNTELTSAPPSTLEEWLTTISNTRKVAFNSDLIEAFWGVPAFGGRVLNEQGQWVLDRGGFVNWIDFIKTVQATPGFIVDTDPTRLQTIFETGEAAYFPGDSRALTQLQAALGEEQLGVAALPGGPSDEPAGPILKTDVFVFSWVAGSKETDLAMTLAEFMTNLEQQSRLIVDPMGRLPAHAQVRYGQNLAPAILELAKQSRTALPISFAQRPIWNELTQDASNVNELYRLALAGIEPSNQAVQEISNQIIQEFGLDRAETSLNTLCPTFETNETQVVTLWHDLQNEEAEALADISQDFTDGCPGVTLELRGYTFEELSRRFRQAVQQGGGPDIIMQSTRLTTQLAEDGLIRDLTAFVEPAFLQQYIPGAEEAMRYQGRLYGLPESVEVLAQYYNTDLVDDPLLNLTEASVRVTPEQQFALPATFFYGYWGFEPFGGFAFDNNAELITNDQGLVDWLAWLQSAQNQQGMQLTTDPAEAQTLFAEGKAAYFVSGPWALSQLRRELGEERFRVAPLPAGPAGPGRPILQVRGVMVNANSDDETAAIAVAFGKYLVTPESQAKFLESGSHVSAVVNINLSDYPLISGFREQAKQAIVVAETTDFSTLEELGNELFDTVLTTDITPIEAVAPFKEAFYQALGTSGEED